MKRRYHLLWQIPLGGIEILLGLIVLYIITAIFGMFWQVGDDYVQQKEGVKIYLRTDGIHTDFIVPVKTDVIYWPEKIRWEDLRGKDTSYQYISFGWGDQGFFLNTPTWADLKFSTAFDAAFYRGKSAMHVVYQNEPEESKLCKRLMITKANYRKLVEYIQGTFVLEKRNGFIVIPGRGYWDYDNFYQAHGNYGLFSTCNSWINGGLKEAGLPACLWTPTSYGILEKYD